MIAISKILGRFCCLSLLSCLSELRELKECKDLIVIIPGNPGEIAFFEYFMELLYQQLGQQWVIIGISHTGHSSYQVIKNTQQQIHEGIHQRIVTNFILFVDHALMFHHLS